LIQEHLQIVHTADATANATDEGIINRTSKATTDMAIEVVAADEEWSDNEEN